MLLARPNQGPQPPEGPCRDRHNPQEPALYYAQRCCCRGAGNGCTRADSPASPPIPISLLSILHINSACRNNCVQHHDRLGKNLLLLVPVCRIALNRKTWTDEELREATREGNPFCYCFVMTNFGVGSFIFNNLKQTAGPPSTGGLI